MCHQRAGVRSGDTSRARADLRGKGYRHRHTFRVFYSLEVPKSAALARRPVRPSMVWSAPWSVKRSEGRVSPRMERAGNRRDDGG